MYDVECAARTEGVNTVQRTGKEGGAEKEVGPKTASP